MTGPTGRATVVRPEAAADAGAIRDLLVRAFETPIEADLVERLRHDRDLVLAMVAADCEHGIVGHVAFPRLHVDHMGQEFPAVGLAPLAVAEAHRRQGVGADLVCRGLDCLASRGEVLAFVLGDPAYYTRFGFAVATAKPFTCAYAGSHFMALQLADTAPPAGTVRYPAAFDGLT